ncbi:hypothetical protein [Mycobacterium sp.]|uniref:hypothetical protein n=1 Tax=Mycobacterium sp. TaxID=1785 RepID=UPI002C5C37F9|nr:hypothetical protein [Mycobacterium sp.]HME50469.1 hypothetical protein [Mycobacterium sp.]
MTTQTTNSKNQFALDLDRIRDEARKHMEAGAVTVGNTIDIERLMEKILEQEEEHADDLKDLLGS